MFRRSSLLVVLLAAIAAPMLAQAPSAVPTADPAGAADTLVVVPAAAPAAAAPMPPSLATAPVAVTRRQAAPGEVQAFQSQAGLGQARAMMIVGAGALLAGAIIDGDAGTIIMVGGAIIGLYGLYKYLQ